MRSCGSSNRTCRDFVNGRSGAIFGRPSKRHRGANSRGAASSEFGMNLRNGFAFNLPIPILGGLALAAYLVK